jgi:hypothetical protein
VTDAAPARSIVAEALDSAGAGPAGGVEGVHDSSRAKATMAAARAPVHALKSDSIEIRDTWGMPACPGPAEKAGRAGCRRP